MNHDAHIRCPHCLGSGSLPLSDVYTQTLAALRQ